MAADQERVQPDPELVEEAAAQQRGSDRPVSILDDVLAGRCFSSPTRAGNSARLMTVVLFHCGWVRLSETTYFGSEFMRSAKPSASAALGQWPAKISYVRPDLVLVPARPEVSVRLAGLGWIAVQQCDYSRARELSGQALRLAAEQGFRVGETFAEIRVAFAARRQGDLDLAERHLTGLLRAAGPEEEGEAPPLHLPLVLTELGFLAERRGQAAEARRLHLRALGSALL